MAASPPTGHLQSRIVAMFALLPLAVGSMYLLWFLSGLLADRVDSNYRVGLIIYNLSLLMPSIVFYGGTLLVWKHSVQWTRRKAIDVSLTTLVFVLACCIALMIPVLFPRVLYPFPVAVSSMGCGIALILFSWTLRSGVQQGSRSAPVACQKCGHDLVGLSKCSCAECGAEYIIGQLARPMDETM